MNALRAAFVCSVCSATFESRSATPRHRCKGDYAGRFGVPLRDATVDTAPEGVPVASHVTTQPPPEPDITETEGDAAFTVEDEDGDDFVEAIEPRLGASEDYVEPKQVDKPTSRGTTVKLATYIAALEHGTGMTTLSPAELSRVKAELAGNAADIHIETAEIVIGAGTSLALSGGLLALIYARDLFGTDMSAIMSMLKPEPAAPPETPLDRWAEGGD